MLSSLVCCVHYSGIPVLHPLQPTSFILEKAYTPYNLLTCGAGNVHRLRLSCTALWCDRSSDVLCIILRLLKYGGCIRFHFFFRLFSPIFLSGDPGSNLSCSAQEVICSLDFWQDQETLVCNGWTYRYFYKDNGSPVSTTSEPPPLHIRGPHIISEAPHHIRVPFSY